MCHIPQISIGLPVWNGQNYLQEAINSILGQSFSDFELIISDNASTDDTEVICRRMASKDNRIQYVRNEKNLGAAKNFNQVFELARGTYFKWAAHDDVLLPTFLEQCVRVLDSDPTVVLSHSKVDIIDESGIITGPLNHQLQKAGSSQPHIRFGHLLLTDRYNYDLHGLIRASALRQTPLFASYAVSDLALRAQLGLIGRFQEIPETLFLARQHPQTASRANQSHQDWAVWFDPDNKGKRLFPHWRILQEYYKIIKKSSLKTTQRLACYLQLVRWVFSNLNWGRMSLELILAFAPGLWKAYWRTRQNLLKKLGYKDL